MAWSTALAAPAATTSSELLSGVIGAALGAVATVAVVLLTPLAQRRDRYDAVLLERRMLAYDRLQQVLAPTSKYDEARGVPFDATRLADDLTRWYFSGDGLYMTTQLRDLFFQLRDDAGVMDRWAIRELASAMRTQMTRDLSSRRPPLLG
ncbi:hypothetical protein Q9R32_01220 [Actinotalea sp. AC32]|nr:hypothetical protein [Actinotalea sp. AC32]